MSTETFAVVVAEVRGRKRLAFTAEQRYRRFVDSQGLGTELRVRIDEPKRTRSVDQLRYWFGVPMAIPAEVRPESSAAPLRALATPKSATVA